MERGNMTIYKDTGCTLSPKCTECLIPLEKCPAQKTSERQGHPQGTLRQDVREQLAATRLTLGGDITDEGSPLNLQWKKYWADKGIEEASPNGEPLSSPQQAEGCPAE